MKTFKSKTVAFIFFVIVIFSNSNLKAQVNIPYNIDNNLPGCSITGTWEVWGLTQNCGVGMPCDNGAFNLAANSSMQIFQFGTGGACSPNDDEGKCIIITITHIGGNLLGTPIVVNSSTGGGTVGNVMPGCTASTTHTWIGTAQFYISN